jgi:sialate O-acetylesterase
VRDARLYRTIFPAMVRDWRRAWGQRDFPFLFVQLANFNPSGLPQPPERSLWAELREAQASALALPATAMVATIDIGESTNIYPRNKQEVGRRLCVAALATAYGRDVVASGPVYDSQNIQGNRIRLYFRSVGSGLASRSGDDLGGFTIAADDRRFVPAHARIEGNTVLVWADGLPHPVAARYAWTEDPAASLANKDGLPAVPFRTDLWPVEKPEPPPPPKPPLPYGDILLVAFVAIALVGYLLIQLRRPLRASEQ